VAKLPNRPHCLESRRTFYCSLVCSSVIGSLWYVYIQSSGVRHVGLAWLRPKTLKRCVLVLAISRSCVFVLGYILCTIVNSNIKNVFSPRIAPERAVTYRKVEFTVWMRHSIDTGSACQHLNSGTRQILANKKLNKITRRNVTYRNAHPCSCIFILHDFMTSSEHISSTDAPEYRPELTP
jgi:hypothetical protein